MPQTASQVATLLANKAAADKAFMLTPPSGGMSVAPVAPAAARTPRYVAPVAPGVPAGKTVAQIQAEDLAATPPAPAVPATPGSPATPTLPPTHRTPQFDANGNPITPAKTFEEYRASQPNTQVDEAAIREGVRQAMQGRIDAVNAVYDSLVGEQKITNLNNTGRTRAVTARSGTLGSDFGNADATNQETANNKALAAIESQRNLAIQGVYDKIDEMTQKKAEGERLRLKGDAENYATYLAQNKEDARGVVKSLAAQGVDLETLTTDQYKKLLDSTGYSDFTFKTIYNEQRSGKAQERVDKILSVGGKVSDEDRLVLDKLYGDGYTKKLEDIKNASTAATTADAKAKVAKDIIDVMKEIPVGTKKVINGVEYEGLKTSNPNTQIFQETDANGNVTFVTIDKNTGTVLSSASGGAIGKPQKNTTKNTPEPGQTFDQWLAKKEQTDQFNYDTTNPAVLDDLESQYKTDTGGSTGGKFTTAQKLKLEQGGLLNAPRQQQLDFLYKKKNSGREV